MFILKYADLGRDPAFWLWDLSTEPLVLTHEDDQTKVYSYGIYELTYSGNFTDPDDPYVMEVSYTNTQTGQGMSIASATGLEDGAWPWYLFSQGFGEAHLTGGLVGENIKGFIGNDEIYGRAGDDTIDGTFGSDYIDGGAGDDTLIGGPQNDTLKGGRGDDTFLFEGNNSLPYYKGRGHSVPKPDIIVDFKQGHDVIDVDFKGVKWIGERAFREDARQIRFEFDRNDEWRPITEVQIQLSGNWKPEFTIILEGRIHLTEADFSF